MALEIQVRNDEGTLKLFLKGRFDFNSSSDFRQATEQEVNGAGKGTIEVDMGGVDYMDSSALGMLMLLKDRADSSGRDVILVNCRGTVKQILEVVNFKEIFTIR